MRTCFDDFPKEKYRKIQLELFDINEIDPYLVQRKKFLNRDEFDFGLISNEKIYKVLHDKFNSSYSEFCIATAYVSDSIYVFDFKFDDISKYYAILNNPHLIPSLDIDLGLSITHERLFFFSTSKHWCLFADRYNDILLLYY